MNTNLNYCRKLALLLAILFLPVAVMGDEVTIMLPGGVPMVLVKVPAGTFLMGSPEGERGNIFDNETQHQVTLTQDYYLGKTEVTQAQWEAVMGTPMRTECGDIAVGDDFPVYCVTWDRISGNDGFMDKLNQLLGTTEFRLPSEAEWERAARAGTSTRYSHGDALECSDECGACDAHDPFMRWCGNVSPFGPVQVGQKLGNQFGLQDMHGNLWEVVNDRYQEFSDDSVTDPTGPGGGGDVVIRGGGREAYLNRSAARLGAAPDDRAQNNEVGFRIAASDIEGLAFQINSGLNDAWYNPATDGQGFLIAVFPQMKQVFVAWFTFDKERPAEGVEAILGDPGHRWLTAQGSFEGDTAELLIYATSGGVFDTTSPVPESEAVGTMTIEFANCSEGLLSYTIENPDMSGTIPIQRIVGDNIALCETLTAN